MIYIYGASGHGRVVQSCVLDCKIDLKGFVDDDIYKRDFNGLPVVKLTDSIMSDYDIVFGIGDNKTRKDLARKLFFKSIPIIHPSAEVASDIIVGTGTVVLHRSTLQSKVKIGMHSIINTNAIIDHDCELGSYVHVSPGAVLCGGVRIGDLSWIGAGSVVVQGVKIGRNAIVGAGAVVLKDVPSGAVVVGNPARIIKFVDVE